MNFFRVMYQVAINWVTVGVSIPPRSVLRSGLGETAMDGKMMRKTMEKMREYHVKQWENNGTFE